MSHKFRQSAGTMPSLPRPAAAKVQPAAPSAGTPTPRAALAPVAGLLLLSGMCGLVFQVCWFREFRLLFGASTAASSAVLAAFMGGLGIGNAVMGKRADRVKGPLAMYAVLELSIAATAAVGPLLIDGLHGLYIALGEQLALGFSAATVVRLMISALVLGAPTFLMGGTLPAAVRAVTLADDHQRRGAAFLYGANTLGAVAGALGSTFFALEFFGTRATLWLACLVNTCTALAALALWRYGTRGEGRPATRPFLAGTHSRHGRRRATGRELQNEKCKLQNEDLQFAFCNSHFSIRSGTPPHVFYAVAGVAGFTFFLMELVWFRMLGPILGGTTFTFGLVLAVALAGIGLGGAAYAVFFRRTRPLSLHSLAFTCVLEACCIAVPFALGDRLAILAVTLRAANAANFFAEVTGWTAVAAIVILPAALVSGVQFPLLVGLLGQGDKDVGRQLGLACGWNTAGAICGSLAGGFGLLPLLSAPGAWRLAVVLMAALGVAVLALARTLGRPSRIQARSASEWAALRSEKGCSTRLRFGLVLGQSRRDPRAGAPSIAVLAMAAAAVGAIACPGPTAVWRHGAVGAGRISLTRLLSGANDWHNWENEVRRSVLWEADGVESSVAIVGADGLAFYVNGMCDGNAVKDVGTQVMLGMIPAALHPRPQAACVVGLGTGETAGWLADVPSVQHVDVVELEPAITEMARRCRALNRDVMANPKVRMIFNDAREVLLTAGRRYDLIVCEPSNPYRSGIANLFTREFYRAGRDRLGEGGLFVQWLQAYEIDRRTARTVLATFRSVFPHVEVWQSKPGDVLLVGSAQGGAYSAAALRGRLAAEPFASALPAAWHATGLECLFAHYVGATALVDQFIREEPTAINTDDHNAIEYGFARSLGKTDWDVVGTLHGLSAQIGDHRPPLSDGAVDWRAVAIARQWEAAVLAGSTPSADEIKLADATSDAVLQCFVAKDARGMVRAWEDSRRPAPCLTELAVVALLYAEVGTSRAEPLIVRLSRDVPIEAEALRGILAWRQGRPGEAGLWLAAALRHLRREPWMLEHVRLKMFDAVIGVAKSDPRQAAELLRAISEPFAANCADESRRATACVIAETVGPVEAAKIVESFEPFAPWTEEFLAYRARIYHAAGHRLAGQAERDKQEFARCDAGARQ